MLIHEFEQLTVTQLRGYAKENGLVIPGAWKMKKADLIMEILIKEEEAQIEAFVPVMIEEENDFDEDFQSQVEDAIVELQQEKVARRGNQKSLHVVLEDGTEYDFDSNKAFADFFNEKHNTNFRHDIAWYIIRNRNKKAKQIFGIKEIA